MCIRVPGARRLLTKLDCLSLYFWEESHQKKCILVLYVCLFVCFHPPTIAVAFLFYEPVILGVCRHQVQKGAWQLPELGGAAPCCRGICADRGLFPHGTASICLRSFSGAAVSGITSAGIHRMTDGGAVIARKVRARRPGGAFAVAFCFPSDGWVWGMK